MTQEVVLKELLGDNFSQVSEPNIDFIGNRDETAIKETYATLYNLGINKKRIAQYASLLILKKEYIVRNFNNLRDLGIATETVDGQARDFISIMQELSSLSTTGLISPQKLSEVANAIGGGARRGPQVEAIIKNLGRANQLAEVSANATTDAYDALGEKLDTVQTSITNLGNAFQKLAQVMGSEGGILNIFQSVVGVATTLVDSSQSSREYGKSHTSYYWSCWSIKFCSK